ncbi:MAG TPA: cytochrome c maturation protein CcmE [Chloroflexota bacterium]|nr:cytochrome c maturation protein CcmE [Candidatus Limnocylindria bacterium]HEU5317377.1 cytochrome c maturation protein CcmE [Chloroflexota bacterium]
MSLARPVPPPLPASRRRWPILLLVAVLVAIIGAVALANVGSALVYYQTPTELLARGPDAIGRAVRLGGLVAPGSLDCTDGGVRFRLTDNQAAVPVATSEGATAFCPREGVGVVVQGTLRPDGTFDPDEVIVKHDENYVAPSDGTLPSQVIDPGQ